MHQNALQMSYTLLKALHIIFVVTWFAGLFCMFRLFVYHREAQAKPQAPSARRCAQFRIMERELGLPSLGPRPSSLWPLALACSTTFQVIWPSLGCT